MQLDAMIEAQERELNGQFSLADWVKKESVTEAKKAIVKESIEKKIEKKEELDGLKRQLMAKNKL